jgi:hypothetical protein
MEIGWRNHDGHIRGLKGHESIAQAMLSWPVGPPNPATRRIIATTIEPHQFASAPVRHHLARGPGKETYRPISVARPTAQKGVQKA